MGAFISRAKLFLYATIQLSRTLEVLKKRLETSPGLPVPNPTLPFWTVPAAQIPRKPPGSLPDYVDIVVVGSGITGTSFAYNALARESSLKIVMLEARAVCSGATGRNGGHVNPPLYHDFVDLVKMYGEHAAKMLVRFRRSHLSEMHSVASVEGVLDDSQCRETEHLDVYTCPVAFAKAKENLAKWRAEMPLESSTFVVHEGEAAVEKYNLSENVVGCISCVGGAIHPYRFVTSLLSILLARHPDNFRIFPHTACTSVSSTPGSHLYTISTPRGTIRAQHVIHATNGWCAHLLPPLLTKIAPARGGMSAQRPGTSLQASTLSGQRSFVFYRAALGYDYLTQLPGGERELMFGGGWAMACDEQHGVPEVGIADDSVTNHVNQSYLAGALPQYFGFKNWGADKAPPPDEGDEATWGLGRTKAQWSGILGISADMLPWVGRLPAKVCGRTSPEDASRIRQEEKDEEKCVRMAPPGEWISAGYTGEGMVHAWMSGKALAYMMLDREDEIEDWFPAILRVTEKRWKEANMENLFARFL